ncbi:hypothetical protein OQA88_8422 [Cercophora sp. LCS_1]
MGPKIPSTKVLQKELTETVHRIYNSDKQDLLTVNYARQAVEEALGLPKGFFKEGDWKERSKSIVHAALEEPVDSEGPKPTPKAATPKKATPKKAAPKKTAPKKEPPTKAKARTSANPKKRSEKESTPSDESETELSDSGSDSGSEEDEPKPKARKRKLAARPKKRAAVSSDEESSAEDTAEETDASASSAEPEPPRKKAKQSPAKKKAPAPKALEQKAPELKAPSDSAPDSPLSEPPPGDPEPEPAADKSESEMSVVFDEPPKEKKAKEPKARKQRKSQELADKAKPTEQSPDDALIKQLQGQLVKCGVRKIWGVELKKYGDDKKAKIRHLKGMLTDIGMTGRFSEARAREIKERRELEADLDAVKEGEKSWGVSGRPRRGAAASKSFKESSDGGPDVQDKPKGGNSGSGDDEDDEGAPKVHFRGPAKRRADLAFLGSESESD